MKRTINCLRGVLVTAVLIFALSYFGCQRKSESLSQQRLHEWIPQSAVNIFSKSSGAMEDTSLVTFSCSESDFERLRKNFAMEEHGEWKLLPFDRRTSDILKMVETGLDLPAAILPPKNSVQIEYLRLPETDPYVPVGHALISDSAQRRLWYISSSK